MDEITSLPIPEPNMVMDLEYLITKRDDALEHFVDKLKSHLLTDEQLHTSLNTVLRLNKQVKLMEDALVAYRIIEANNIE